MRQLLLLRHAKSSWDDPALPDHARPLNARGRRAAQAMAAEMQRLGLTPDVVLVSSARRTLQTMEALRPFEGSPMVTVLDGLYLAPWRGMLETLNEVPDTVRSVLMIGHNPGLHELALELLPPDHPETQALKRLRDAYPTGGLAEFGIAAPWHQLAPAGARLVRYVVPRDLPEATAMANGGEHEG
ncbi:histidine phosphatase family protein [Rhodovarius crocodyli]|uniref:Histidine phosphatase family protein n=1 Tax=Rhodovarius crocodyli TaxID=1979269 RepID=A0A437ME65_9PROT|nr:histidine phosphatase family protein [Rhodovarius crocodyli]RVT95934.1 histidine phosphatase family protein [Rhodovarius crocodyli]